MGRRILTKLVIGFTKNVTVELLHEILREGTNVLFEEKYGCVIRFNTSEELRVVMPLLQHLVNVMTWML